MPKKKKKQQQYKVGRDGQYIIPGKSKKRKSKRKTAEQADKHLFDTMVGFGSGAARKMGQVKKRKVVRKKLKDMTYIPD